MQRREFVKSIAVGSILPSFCLAEIKTKSPLVIRRFRYDEESWFGTGGIEFVKWENKYRIANVVYDHKGRIKNRPMSDILDCHGLCSTFELFGCIGSELTGQLYSTFLKSPNKYLPKQELVEILGACHILRGPHKCVWPKEQYKLLVEAAERVKSKVF